MNMTKTTRGTLILLASAAFLAAALIPALASAQAPARPASPARPEMQRGPWADLGLTPDQVKALEAFRKTQAEARRTFRDQMMKLGDEMRQLRQDPQANQAKIDALIDQRAGLMASHEKAAVRARIDRNKIFTPEQLEKLKAMRSRLGARGGMGRGRMGGAWMGRGRGGRFFGPRAGFGPMARWRAFRDRAFLRWWG
jgi:Spy/CpxP family protein refolding chaperone